MRNPYRLSAAFFRIGVRSSNEQCSPRFKQVMVLRALGMGTPIRHIEHIVVGPVEINALMLNG